MIQNNEEKQQQQPRADQSVVVCSGNMSNRAQSYIQQPQQQHQHQQQVAMSINKHQLITRVKSITGKLLESRGAELRRTLFSLRQIFQDDADLAIEFVESDGLDCLMKLGSGADQIHQNYILRAIGQLITYQAGMNALSSHGEIIRWMYTLIASQHRLVAKTSLRLLISFVEYDDNNCLKFCQAIKFVDESNDSHLWSNVTNLFKTANRLPSQQQQYDVGILVDAMTLINKTLAGISDRETFYDYLDPLEEAGMESIIQKYSNLDAQLREQFKLYEQSLGVEEDEDDEVAASPEERLSATNGGSSNMIADSHRQQGDSNMVTKSNSSSSNNKTSSSQTSKQNPTDNVENVNSEHPGRQREFNAVRGTRRDGSVTKPPEANAVDCTNSGDTTNDDDEDDYESADEKLNGSPNVKHPAAPAMNPRLVVQTLNTEQNNQAGKRQQHQLQLRQQQPIQYQRNNSLKQNNLARGKQQRASISSCSSSDSYASYGSGYASGSGNSTDHEHKQLLQQRQHKSSNIDPPEGDNQLEQENNVESTTRQLHHKSRVTFEKISDESAGKDQAHHDRSDYDEDGESQLKQHLSELEQLTDELAKRDLLSDFNQPSQSTSSHYSSTIKSTTSSVLSTGSNISSLASNNGDDTLATKSLQQQQDQLQADSARLQLKQSTPTPQQPQLGIVDSNESRSTSATPTSSVQANGKKTGVAQHQTTTTLSASAYSKQTHVDDDEDNDTMAINTKPFRVCSQSYTAPSSAGLSSSSSPSGHNLQSKTTGPTTPANQQQQQEPYYHNLFQWEQLVSKGVTRPLLINDLDFTDLREEDDCDLLNGSSVNHNGGATRLNGRNQASGEPLTITIPASKQHVKGNNLDNDSVDSGASTSSPSSANAPGTPASAPPPLPPPPISPWFNTISGSRPQSQFMSSPSPTPYEPTSNNPGQQGSNEFTRDQSPASSTYSSYSRNSVCVPQHMNTSLNNQFNTLQPVGSLRSASSMSSLLFGNNGRYGNKRKKTMKLFWKEVREDRSLLSKITKKKTIWDEIKPIQVDTNKLEYLFESKAKDLLLSKSRNSLDGSNQRKAKITVLDAKRSNAINIGMTKLPPMRTIKSAILKMDSSIMNREGIEKILTTMMPSEEEKSRIIEAQLANPDTPLGTAEQFLLNLASISALEARLKLWAFQLDYSQIEKEVAEPLMDLKQAIDEIERSETFRIILGTLLAIGNFLNSTNAKGFQIDYLEKVPEVKDTVHKHSLLHHLCLFIQEKYDPELTSDLYSEFSAVNRASKVDYTEVAKNLKKMQQDCKASWDYLKIVAKHDGLANLMNACGTSSSSSSTSSANQSNYDSPQHQPKSSGKLNNLSKLSMITTVIGSDTANDQQQPTTKQLKTKVSDFLTDCAERIMVLMVIHRRVMNRFQKLLVYLGCPSSQIKQTQPQQILKIINEFALEYRTKRERVREMLLKNQQCRHHGHHHQHQHANRWQLNRLRWAGSQQCIDALGYNNSRPLSTSSCAASCTMAGNCPDCALEARHRSIDHHHVNQNQQHNSSLRSGSPSSLSQISNYSDYLLDQSCCSSRQVSITPVPTDKRCNCRKSHPMSTSMLDLQQQQHQGHLGRTKTDDALLDHKDNNLTESELARQKDEQMRRLLGAGKSIDGACGDLYQMSHWSTTMARVTRHPVQPNKQRAASIDSSGAEMADGGNDSMNSNSSRRQSSYYKYLNGSDCHMEDEQNSDEEILQSLVRAATARSNHHRKNASPGINSLNMSSDSNGTPNNSDVSNRIAKNKILSRFSCERKSYEYQQSSITSLNSAQIFKARIIECMNLLLSIEPSLLITQYQISPHLFLNL